MTFVPQKAIKGQAPCRLSCSSSGFRNFKVAWRHPRWGRRSQHDIRRRCL